MNGLIKNLLKGWDSGRGMQAWVQAGAGLTDSSFLSGELLKPGQGLERAIPVS